MLPNIKVAFKEQPIVAFNPDLDDATLDDYRKLAAGADGPVRDAMLDCLVVVDAWWQLPESTRKAKLNLLVSHRKDPRDERQDVQVPVILLEDAHKATLDDLIPWSHQIKAMDELFNGVQVENHDANNLDLDAWAKAVQNYILAKTFTAKELAHLQSKERRALRRMLVVMEEEGTATEETVRNVISAMCPGYTPEIFRDHAKRRLAADALIARILNGDEQSPIPKPVLRDVALRHAANHLIWFVKELDQGREPMTRSKLG